MVSGFSQGEGWHDTAEHPVDFTTDYYSDNITGGAQSQLVSA
jgi:hypothetical protein